MAKAVVFCTGGFAGSVTRLGKNSLMEKIQPDIANLPTSNPPSATGDCISLAEDAGAASVDMFYVQVHPTGFIHPDKPRESQQVQLLWICSTSRSTPLASSTPISLGSPSRCSFCGYVLRPGPPHWLHPPR